MLNLQIASKDKYADMKTIRVTKDKFKSISEDLNRMSQLFEEELKNQNNRSYLTSKKTHRHTTSLSLEPIDSTGDNSVPPRRLMNNLSMNVDDSNTNRLINQPFSQQKGNQQESQISMHQPKKKIKRR